MVSEMVKEEETPFTCVPSGVIQKGVTVKFVSNASLGIFSISNARKYRESAEKSLGWYSVRISPFFPDIDS
jgi:hypothetical protein